MIIFIEADDPDGACYFAISRIMNEVLDSGKTIKNRILCRKIKRKIRIERIESL